jgi:chaperonin GroEL
MSLYPMDLRRGSQAAVDRVIEFLSVNMTMTAEIARVATIISANGDMHVGDLSAPTTEEITEGMRFDRGFISPYFISDFEFEKPLISLSEKILVLQDILPSLEAAARSCRPLVIIAEDVNGEATAACILN